MEVSFRGKWVIRKGLLYREANKPVVNKKTASIKAVFLNAMVVVDVKKSSKYYLEDSRF